MRIKNSIERVGADLREESCATKLGLAEVGCNRHQFQQRGAA
jgi:hypothetical protein